MQKAGKINNFPAYILKKDTALKYATDIARLVDQIPLVDYSEKEVLAEAKGDRIFHGKWEHSLIVFDGEKPIAVMMGYERKAEKNDQYPENSLYISELAVDENYQRQGIAKKLVELFLKYNQKFNHLEGEIVYTIQTNSAGWNEHIQDLYKSFDFKQIAKKEYKNRTDVILKLVRN